MKETPIIKIKYKYDNIIDYIYLKLEYYNVTGSIKDRIAKYIIDKAISQNKLKKGMNIVEATSGNTGIAVAAYASKLGFECDIFMPEHVSLERKKIIKSYGARLHLIKERKDSFLIAIEKAKKYSINNNGYFISQFTNKDNIQTHYLYTAKEIYDKLKNNNIECDLFVSGIGTGGSIMGISKYLKQKSNINTLLVIPKEKEHKIEGINDGFIPSIVDFNLIDEKIQISSNDAIVIARKLSKELGLGVGISTGANVLGSIIKNDNLNVVTIASDDSKKYLSTDLFNERIISKYNRSIEFIDYEFLK